MMARILAVDWLEPPANRGAYAEMDLAEFVYYRAPSDSIHKKRPYYVHKNRYGPTGWMTEDEFQEALSIAKVPRLEPQMNWGKDWPKVWRYAAFEPSVSVVLQAEVERRIRELQDRIERIKAEVDKPVNL